MFMIVIQNTYQSYKYKYKHNIQANENEYDSQKQ